MERYWAFKRIKSLFNNPTDTQCEKTFEFNDYNEIQQEESLSNETICYKKAVALALKYNFVTKATSLVVEAENDYIPKETIGIFICFCSFISNVSHKS